MLWPERCDTWRDGAKPAQAAFTAVAHAIAAGEPVTVGVSAQQYLHARARLDSRIRVLELSTDDAWARDTGATFVVNSAGRRRAVDWMFNAWGGQAGGLFWPWNRDDEVARKMAEVEGVDRYRAPLVLEGGAVHVDGQGTCLTTEECLLNPNRNAGMTRSEIEELLCRYLGVQRVIWLARGVYLDETGGHIDELACFVRPGHVLLTWTDNPRDPQYAISRDALQRLSSARDARGRALVVHKIPQPDPMHMTSKEAAGIDLREGSRPRCAGDRLAGSYVNFYVGNGVVVMPKFNRPQDAAAARVLARLFPTRKIKPVETREILLGGGNIHCITQQIPASIARGASRTHRMAGPRRASGMRRPHRASRRTDPRPRP